MSESQDTDTRPNRAEQSPNSKIPSSEDNNRNDQPTKKPSNRLSRLFKRRSAPTSSSTTTNTPTEGATDTNQKRRQQVYQAQKRHRNREAEHVSNLETEIAQLQHLDSVTHAEMKTLTHENRRMRAVLASETIDHQMVAMSLAATPDGAGETSQLGSAAVQLRFDPVIGHERTFVDVSERVFSNRGNNVSDAGTPTKRTAGEGDSWAALDFILSLEHCCQGHTVHSGINPSAHLCGGGEDGCHGHALSMSAAVYQSALPPGKDVDREDTLLYSQPQIEPEKWQLPHSEIDKLVAMSEQLPLDNSEMTPAQAYSAMRESVPDVAYMTPVMEALKVLLAPQMACFGFGAVMPSIVFWDRLDTVLKTLGLKAPKS